MKSIKNLKIYFVILGLFIAAVYVGWGKVSNVYDSLVNYADLYLSPVQPNTKQEEKKYVRGIIYQEKLKEGEVQILPAADPEWNLDRNFKYGFQIQYPSEWEEPFSTVYLSDKKIIVSFSRKQDIGDASIRRDFFMISITDVSDINDYFKNYEDFLRQTENNAQLGKTKMITDFIAYRFDLNDPFWGTKTIEYVVYIDGKIYHIYSDPMSANLYLDKVFKTLVFF